MDRLTFNTAKYGAGIWEMPNYTCKEICELHKCDNCPIQKVFNKLSAYEDAEEHGCLVKLPLKYGDHIYEAYESEGKVLEWEVTGYKVAPDGMYIYVGGFGISINASKLGVTLFRTREEAEKKLEEMKNA